VFSVCRSVSFSAIFAPMPLLFPSLSHGEIAFGFFNIETDMLLLNHLFFFASDFCREVSEMSLLQKGEMYVADWEIYRLKERNIGSVMGAINRIDLRGFIGEVYICYPFPEDMAAFKQNPDGYRTRPEIEARISRYGIPETIRCAADSKGSAMDIGEFRFSRPQFHRLIRYVYDGGYPRWKNDHRPDYVDTMAHNLRKSSYPLLSGFTEVI
jgi:hypothetical protein